MDRDGRGSPRFVLATPIVHEFRHSRFEFLRRVCRFSPSPSGSASLAETRFSAHEGCGGSGTTEWTPPPPLGVWCRRSGTPGGPLLADFPFHGSPHGNGGSPGRRGFSGDALPHTHEPPVHDTANAGTAAGVGMGLWSSSIGGFCLGAATSPCSRGGAPTRRRPSPGSRPVREAGYSRVHGFVRTRGLHNFCIAAGSESLCGNSPGS